MSNKALLIAVNETKVHPYADKPLNKTVSEVCYIKKALNESLSAYDIEVLSNHRSTSEGIRKGFEKLLAQHLQNNDRSVILLYWTGHGTSQGLVAYDEIISYDDICKLLIGLSRCGTNKILAVFDCCYSGNLTFELIGSENIVIVSSCSISQEAIEPHAYELSLFARHFIDGLSGLSPNFGGNVDAGSLYTYICYKIELDNENKVGRQQIPTIYRQGNGEFTVLCLPESKRTLDYSANYIMLRSFSRRVPQLPFRDSLDLSQHFTEGKFINDTKSWDKVREEIDEFQARLQATNGAYHTYLECSYTVAFLFGRAVGTQLKPYMRIAQQTHEGLQRWSDIGGIGNYENLIFETLLGNCEKSEDSVLVISLTHPRTKVECDVNKFLSEQEHFKFRKFHRATLENAGQNAVKCGMHSWNIADTLICRLKRLSVEGGYQRLHIFIAAPVGVAYTLGRLSSSSDVGKLVLYEHSMAHTKYMKSLTIN